MTATCDLLRSEHVNLMNVLEWLSETIGLCCPLFALPIKRRTHPAAEFAKKLPSSPTLSNVASRRNMTSKSRSKLL